MVGLGQLEATTGRKRRPSYTDIINAENVYLPQKVQARKDRQYAEELQDFREKQADIDTKAAWEVGHEGRKQGRYATNIGLANLGTNILGNTEAFSDLYSSIMDLF